MRPRSSRWCAFEDFGFVLGWFLCFYFKTFFKRTTTPFLGIIDYIGLLEEKMFSLFFSLYLLKAVVNKFLSVFLDKPVFVLIFLYC